MRVSIQKFRLELVSLILFIKGIWVGYETDRSQRLSQWNIKWTHKWTLLNYNFQIIIDWKRTHRHLYVTQNLYFLSTWNSPRWSKLAKLCLVSRHYFWRVGLFLLVFVIANLYFCCMILFCFVTSFLFFSFEKSKLIIIWNYILKNQ